MPRIEYHCPCGLHVRFGSKEEAIEEYDNHSECEWHHFSEIYDMDDYKDCESCTVHIAVTVVNDKNVCMRCSE